MTTKMALANFRSSHGLTLDGAAAALGVDRKTVLRWEQGKVLIPAERVLEVERVTGISRYELRPDLAAIFAKTEAAA